MALQVIRFAHQSSLQWGLLDGMRVVPISGAPATTGEFLLTHDSARLRRTLSEGGPGIHLGDVRILAPVTANQQFICQGANYRQHMIESGVDPDLKTFNMVFTKAPSCIVPADSDIVRPARVSLLDYEIELGLVLKRDIAHRVTVTAANLPDYVAGLVIVNDVSARDVQIPEMQFYKGKSFRTFGPVGPLLCLLEPQDFGYLDRLQLELRVNGEVRQRDTTANLVWGPAATLSELSGVHDLQAGDLIATGTPAGCALSVPSPMKQRVGALLPEAVKWRAFHRIQQARRQYLQPGDVIESTIRSDDGVIDLGRQRNRVVEEA